MESRKLLFAILCVNSLLYTLTQSSTVSLETTNIESVLKNTDFVFVNFYANWCRFSQMLKPIFENTAKKIKEEFPEGIVKLGTVDCEKQKKIAEKYHVSKFPTLKIFRNGVVMKKEFRGQRSVDALSKFVRDQVKNIIIQVKNIDELDKIERKKGSIIGFFDGEGNEDYKSFKTLSDILRDYCIFYAVVSERSSSKEFADNKVIFRPAGDSPNNDIPYSGLLKDEDVLKAWGVEKCIPLIREITFQNAEELIEEGIPFLVLFRDPNDQDIYDRFKSIIQKELLGEKISVNFLVADGFTYSNPLNKIGKKPPQDLPLVAIDNFKHMFVFPKDTKEFIDQPGELKSFIDDLHSGKLHREFHSGPANTNPQGNGDVDHMHAEIRQQLIMSADGTPITVLKVIQAPHDKHHNIKIKDVDNQIINGNLIIKNNPKKALTRRPDDSVVVKDEVAIVKKTARTNINTEDASSHHKSVFQKLGPSDNRYSFERRDEL